MWLAWSNTGTFFGASTKHAPAIVSKHGLPRLTLLQGTFTPMALLPTYERPDSRVSSEGFKRKGLKLVAFSGRPSATCRRGRGFSGPPARCSSYGEMAWPIASRQKPRDDLSLIDRNVFPPHFDAAAGMNLQADYTVCEVGRRIRKVHNLNAVQQCNDV